MVLKRKYIITSICFFYIFSILLCGCENDSQKNQVKNAEVTTIEQAKEYAIGTWQFTNIGKDTWAKFVIKQDGSADTYWSAPRDGKWNGPRKGIWEVGSDRYSDTGEKFCFVMVKFKDQMSRRIAFTNTNEVYEYFLGIGKRTDINPWKD